MILHFIIIDYFLFSVWTNGVDKNSPKTFLRKINFIKVCLKN